MLPPLPPVAPPSSGAPAVASTPDLVAPLVGTGSIAGQVTDESQTPIGGAWVWALADGASSWTGPATAAGDGSYVLAGLQPGAYSVYSSASGYAGEYYNGKYNYYAATHVNVTAGATTSGINFALARAGAISGTVTNASATPIGGATVWASGTTCCSYGSATAAPDGTYTITNLLPGTYLVQASAAGYVATYYNGTYDYSAATRVNVTSDATTPGINVALALGGSISGTITNTSAAPLAGASVQANGTTCCGWGWATAAADGSYIISGLAPGSYTVWASASACPPPPGGTCVVYPGQYYNGTYDYGAATHVSVASGATTPGINLALALGGTISGTVANASSTPIAGASVQASNTICCSYGSATTAADGTYSITGLVPGSYVVQAAASTCGFSPPSPSCQTYPAQYYSGTYDYSAATHVNVTSGATTPGIDFALAPGGTMSGTVTNASATPIAGASVQASRTACCGWGSATTAADGTYTITGLAAGSYVVQAGASTCAPSPPGGACGAYAVQYYNGTYDYSAATPVTVIGGLDTPGINFALELGGAISGTVMNASATPIAGASVQAGRTVCCGWGSATTAADGTYVIAGLAPGSYLVQALGPACGSSPPDSSCSAYVPQYYDGAYDPSAATPVVISSGAAVPGIDFALSLPSALHPLPIGLTFAETRDTSGASLQPSEPQPCGTIGATVWYQITVPASPPGHPTISVDTVGSDFNTAVAVYVAGGPGATPLSGSALLSCKANGSQSMMIFTGTQGATYFVQVGGQSGATGHLAVNVSWDSSGDGYTDVMKSRLGKNPSLYCAVMRADVNYDGWASIIDMALIGKTFGTTVPPAAARLDQDKDSLISILDMAAVGKQFGKNVAACP